MFKIELEKTTLAALQVYAPNEQSEYPAFLLKVEAATQLAAKPDHFILMGDFNAHEEMTRRLRGVGLGGTVTHLLTQTVNCCWIFAVHIA